MKNFIHYLSLLIFLVIFIYASIYLFLIKIFPIEKQLESAGIVFVKENELEQWKDECVNNENKDIKENIFTDWWQKNTKDEDIELVPLDDLYSYDNYQDKLEIVENNLSKGLVSVLSKNKKNTLYDENDIIANALVISNDGWIVLNTDIYNQGVRFVFDGKFLEEEKAVKDPALNLTYIKVKANNLSVLKFINNSNEVLNGELLLNFDTRHRVNPINLVDKYYLGNRNLSIKKLNKRFLLSSTNKDLLLGSALLDLNGDLVAIIDQVNDNLITAIPVNYLSIHLLSIYNNKWINYDLGIKYQDLAYSLEKYYDYNQGALILENYKLSNDDYLYKGDLVLKVNGEDLNKVHSLNELIQEYQKEGTVVLTVFHNGKIIEKELELKYKK